MKLETTRYMSELGFDYDKQNNCFYCSCGIIIVGKFAEQLIANCEIEKFIEHQMGKIINHEKSTRL